MTCYIVEGYMGSGKTLFTTIYSIKNQHLYNTIIANYKINSPKIKFLTFPLPEITEEKCLLIYDDILTADKKLLGIINSIIASLSRKKEIDIFITTQRSIATIDKTLRMLSYLIFPQYNKITDELNIVVGIEKLYKFIPLEIHKPYEVHCSKYFGLYDTKEITIPLNTLALIESLRQLSPFSQEYYTNIVENKDKKLGKLIKEILKGK